MDEPDFTPLRSKLIDSARLADGEFLELANSASLAQLALLADEMRQRCNPGRLVTYLIDRNINYTNVCHTDCSFCGFYRHSSDHPEAYVNSNAAIGTKIEEARELGATRILLQGGHNDQLPYEYYLELIDWIHTHYEIEINAFSPSEIQQMQRISGKSYREILSELKIAGMRGLPGGGAEILDDEVRKRVSPKKISADEWIRVMRVAHELELTTTATMVIGFGETLEQRLNHWRRIRKLQDESRHNGLQGFNAFIAWPLQHNKNTSMGRSRHANNFGASAVEYLRNLALSRIYLDNVPHHQSSWPTCGAEIAQLGLHMGADDFGSTMIEENVVSQAGAPTKVRCIMHPEELRAHIRQAGFVPAQRDTAYNILKEFPVESSESTLKIAI